MAAFPGAGGLLRLAVLVLATAVPALGAAAAAVNNGSVEFEVTRKSFPAGFIFGAGSAAYQVEGAANEGGRGPSIWDTYTHEHADKINGRSNGDVAVDFYHHYKEDVNFLKSMNMDAFRFSISWPRILPKGTISGGINKEGVQFYNNLINYLLANGLQPFVTLFHWDLPQALETEYLGFLSPRIVDDFRAYAELAFQLFGDRVKYWTTFNEPWSFCDRGYSYGTFAPGRCSSFASGQCAQGNSATEPYIAGHHLLLAHAAAVKVYRDKYKATQKGVIGITLVTNWFEPYSNSKADIDSVGRALDFMFGWFMDPLTTGDYPFSMRAIARERLPVFTAEQAKLVKGSYDFLGLNYYTTWYAKSISPLTPVNVSYDNDVWASESGLRDGVPIGNPDPLNFFFTYPQGLNKLLHYIKDNHNNPVIYITENGIDNLNDPSVPLDKALKDPSRIDFHRKHLYYLQKTIKEGVNVKGYFSWSLLDDFEWDSGFNLRFGLIYVDFKTLQRYPKLSSFWFRQILKK